MKPHKRRKPKKREEKPMSVERKEPEWVTEMHEHFQRTGAFRADDLERVLGDPRDAVEVKAVGEFQCGAFQPKDD